MDMPPEVPLTEKPETIGAGSAYELFWDSVENDAGEDSGSDGEAGSAYRQFWEVSEV